MVDIHPPGQQDRHRHRQAHQHAIGIAKDRLYAVPHITSALGKSPALSNHATRANTCEHLPLRADDTDLCQPNRSGKPAEL
jgi:hypothetical protein